MPTKPTYEIQTANTQAKTRKLVTVYDQHRSARFPNGRPFWGYAEMPAERGGQWGIVGSLTPGNHLNPFGDTWESPWLPDDKWMQPNVDTGRLTINYVGMMTEYRAATEKYYEQCAEVAHENKWIAPEFGGYVDHRFRGVVGKYLPQSPKIPQAAMAGDPWILGFTTEINEGLAKVLRETTYGRALPFGQPTDLQAPAASPAPVVDDAVTLTNTELSAMIAAEVAKALAAPKPAPSPDRVAAAAKMRAAKDAKRAAQAQATAA